MQSISDKFLAIIGTEQKVNVNIDTAQIENSSSKKIWRVHIDNKLGYEKHINTICGKTRAKIRVLERVAPYLSHLQAKPSCFNS